MIAYFYGVRPGETSGHYLWAPGYRMVDWGRLTPWNYEREPIGERRAQEATNGPRKWDDPEPEGDPRFLREDGWTLMTLWDRSGDCRGGCSAIFAIDREMPDADMLAECRRLWPEVFARIEAHLGREVAP